MKMENLDIRMKVVADGLLYKDIAEEMGITDVHLSRLMSKKLTLENRERILTAINNLKRTELTEDEKEGQKRFNEWLNKKINSIKRGIEMRFEDDKPLECERCGEMIYAGDCALEWDGKTYCCEDCVKDAMYEKYGNEVELRRLFTAEDYEAEYGDMKYDEMRGK